MTEEKWRAHAEILTNQVFDLERQVFALEQRLVACEQVFAETIEEIERLRDALLFLSTHALDKADRNYAKAVAEKGLNTND